MVLYMKVTKDRYELPIAVAPTMAELARLCGTVQPVISRVLNRKGSERQKEYVKVVIPDEDEHNRVKGVSE